MTALSPRDRYLAELAVRLTRAVAARDRAPETTRRAGIACEALGALIDGRVAPAELAGCLETAEDELWAALGIVGRASDADRLALARAALCAIRGDVRALALLRAEGFEVPEGGDGEVV